MRVAQPAPRRTRRVDSPEPCVTASMVHARGIAVTPRPEGPARYGPVRVEVGGPESAEPSALVESFPRVPLHERGSSLVREMAHSLLFRGPKRADGPQGGSP